MKNLIEYDKESILSEEVFIEIFEQEDEILKARMLLSCQERAKELGVKTAFDDLVKAYRKVEKAESRRKYNQVNTLVENFTNFTGKYDNMACGAWIASDSGITTMNKDYNNEIIACYHPILPIKRMKNLETGEEQIQLAYKRNHKWTEITVPKDLISSASKIVSLSKLGVSVTSENARLLVKYLSDVENLNDDDIPVQMSSSKLGWIGGGFIPYDTDIVFDGDMQFKYVYESIREHGSFQVWLEHVKQLRKSGRMEIKFYLAASFASVLVGLLGTLPFIVDLWGDTEGGKSVDMMLATSVWANPADNAYIADFKTSLGIRSDYMNVTYEYYKDSFGGSLISESRWNSLEIKMSARLNRYTFDRMTEGAWSAKAKTALCEMCDCAYKYAQRDGKMSENNDGYSVSYDTGKSLDSMLYEIAEVYLVNTGLMSLAVDDNADECNDYNL